MQHEQDKADLCRMILRFRQTLGHTTLRSRYPVNDFESEAVKALYASGPDKRQLLRSFPSVLSWWTEPRSRRSGLVLLRQGRSQNDDQGRFSGWADVPLADASVAQCEVGLCVHILACACFCVYVQVHALHESVEFSLEKAEELADFVSQFLRS